VNHEEGAKGVSCQHGYFAHKKTPRPRAKGVSCQHGYFAHTKTPRPLGPPKDLRLRLTVGSLGGGGFL